MRGNLIPPHRTLSAGGNKRYIHTHTHTLTIFPYVSFVLDVQLFYYLLSRLKSLLGLSACKSWRKKYSTRDTHSKVYPNNIGVLGGFGIPSWWR